MSDKNGTPEKPSVEELRAEIKLTRAELGETVQALAAKADVKARAREQVEQTKQRAKDQVEHTRQMVMHQAAEAAEKVRSRVRAATEPQDGTPDIRERTGSVPVSLIVAGVVAIAGIILIVRGRRR
jgi:ElaB/YqjD/DUF883 family membrane-anchored ribosome-binding protein